MENSAPHKHPVCKRVLLEKSDVQEFLANHPRKQHAAHIPEGIKVTKDVRPNVVQRETGSGAPNQWPYNVIGKLFYGGASFDRENPDGSVTAALVGPKIIVTASSQIPWSTPGLWLRFVPGFNDGNEPFGSAFVLNAYGYLSSVATANNNYVAMELDSPLGNTCGWLGTYANQDNAAYLQDQNWNTVGYPADGPFLFQGLPIERDDVGGEDNRKDFFAEQVFTVADFPGWYGAPMFGTPSDELAGNGGPYVIGVVSGNFEYDGSDYIVYAGGEDLLSIVTWAYMNYS